MLGEKKVDIISHIIFAFLIAKQKAFSFPLFLGAVLPDLDRLYSYSRGKYRGAKSRTLLQELPFLSLLITIGVLIGQPLFSLGITSHFLLDFLLGETLPFSPFFKKNVDFNIPIRFKVIIGGIIWVIGAVYIIS